MDVRAPTRRRQTTGRARKRNDGAVALADALVAPLTTWPRADIPTKAEILGAEAVAVDLVNSDLVADNSLGGIQ